MPSHQSPGTITKLLDKWSRGDEDALAEKIDHDWRNRETYDADDGSVVNW